MAESMQITKVKYDGRKVHIEYSKPRRDGGVDEFALTSEDKPKPAFNDALQSLSNNIVKMCEFQGGDVEVRGCSFTYAKGIMGVVITALKPLNISNAPLVVNTPHMTEKGYAEGDEGGASGSILPKAVVTKLQTVIEETQRYVKGSRAQGALFEVK